MSKPVAPLKAVLIDEGLIIRSSGQLIEGVMARRAKVIPDERGRLGEARGKGLMLGVEFVKDQATKEPAPELAAKVRTRCHQRGVLIEIGGHYFNVARFLPPLVLTEELARKGVEVFAESVKELDKAEG